jgi:hypothetical protein
VELLDLVQDATAWNDGHVDRIDARSSNFEHQRFRTINRGPPDLGTTTETKRGLDRLPAADLLNITRRRPL